MKKAMKQNYPRDFKTKVKKFFFGTQVTDSLFTKIAIYTLLISIGFLYIYPMLYMLSNSLKSQSDIVNPMVNWVPTSLYFGNYERAFRVLNFFPTLWKSLFVTMLPALIQTMVTALIGYGFAKFDFKFKKMWFV
ncbi:MAG: carbohydrate ABC transporter permease, partial [Firmicutes bacterium]|nr:carbohydrate ABC transporter permease [Bacillota bacterium]